MGFVYVEARMYHLSFEVKKSTRQEFLLRNGLLNPSAHIAVFLYMSKQLELEVALDGASYRVPIE
jgi:hypothetical protein